MLFGLTPTPGFAQVSVQPGSDGFVIVNKGSYTQRLVRAAGKTTGGGWVVADETGYSYPIGGYLGRGSSTGGSDDPDDRIVVVGDGYQAGGSSTGGRDDPDDPIVVVVDGYQAGGSSTGGSDDPDDRIVVVGDGYQQALAYLEESYGVEVVHDGTLGVDLLILPPMDMEDPLSVLLHVVTTDTVAGRPIIEYFRLVELATLGAFDLPAHEPTKPLGAPLAFPNDLYYKNEWNLRSTRLAQAQWHTAIAQKAVRVGIIDSGIAEAQRLHEGLDGAEIHYEAVAPTTGSPLDHGLGITSLLADRNQEGSGIVGLLGSWDGNGCYAQEPLLQHKTPQIYVYNVGDFAPSSLYIARAIRRSIEQGVDVINLSIRLAYSPSVAEAIQDALDHNIIVVAAAGNYVLGTAQRPASFPANMEGVIAVGAVGEEMTLSAFSANEGVDILAPGEDVLVGGRDNVWYGAEGTSFAAPHVTAAVAMMRAVRPDLTPSGALEALQQRAWAKDKTGGIGVLNGLSSLNHVLPPSARARYIADPHACDAAGMVDDGSAGKGGAWAQVEGYDDAIDDDLFAAQTAANDLPQDVNLLGNYPNPFNPETTIRFALPEAQQVRLSVFNMLGQRVQVLAEERYEAGMHEVRFQAHDLPSGLYVTRLETEAGSFTQTMTLAK